MSRYHSLSDMPTEMPAGLSALAGSSGERVDSKSWLMESREPEPSSEAAPSCRERHGFRRTECGCAFCQAPCRHVPGSLDVADLTRLCPPGQELFAWAERHLRAVIDKPFPTLVPARRADGPCHWYLDGKCAVHANAPYGCACFDAHMTEAEAAERETATIQARQEDAARNGLYYRVWLHLARLGLTAPSGDRDALAREVRQLSRPRSMRCRTEARTSCADRRAAAGG